MFSVIIPTMWRVGEFLSDLSELDSCEKVGEIILVNNNIEMTPSSFSVQNYSKVLEIKPPKNMYINPSWNLGVRCAKYDKIAIKNDDTFFDYFRTLIAIENELNDDDCLIGTYLNHHNYKITQTSQQTISFNAVSRRDVGFGCCMFFNKRSYVPINEKVLIWYGDDFIAESYTRRGLKIKTIHGINTNGYISATIEHVSELITLKYKDEQMWNENKEILFKECGL